MYHSIVGLYVVVRDHLKIEYKAAIYNLTTLCLHGTRPCVYFMGGIMGDRPYTE